MKKLISLALALVMCLGCFTPALAADSPSSWAAAEVNEAVSLGLVPEQLRSNYTEPMTRAEYNDIAAGNLSGEEYAYAREFAEADEILIGAPYWDCSVPALLKIYLERVCVNGIMFRYGEGGRTVKTCACGKLTYITTSGGYVPDGSSLELYVKELCELFSIPEVRFIKADGLDIWGNDAEKIVRETAERI